MSFAVKILGSNASVPSHNRNQTSQVLSIGNKHILIDCGEGTQIQLRKYKVSFQRIDQVYISHLHGDHFFGLIGFISSLHLNGRQKPLYIFGPTGLGDIITIQLKYSHSHLGFQIVLKEWTPNVVEQLHEDDNFTVQSFPLNHRIDCSGFIFQEKPKKRNIIKERLQKEITPSMILKLKDGQDILDENGNVVFHYKRLTTPPPKTLSYAFCSDTKYDESIIPAIEGADILYHEATFMKDMQERANLTCHSTTTDAGLIAKKANVKKLIIGHFSSRYTNLDLMLDETKSVFENAYLAIEGETFVPDHEG